VADRATNICEQVVFMVEGQWPRSAGGATAAPGPGVAGADRDD
jgi:hypothetical protein